MPRSDLEQRVIYLEKRYAELLRLVRELLERNRDVRQQILVSR